MDEQGITPAELNRRADLSRTTVGDILKGAEQDGVRSPRLATLQALADALDVSVSYLIGESDVRGEELSLLRDFETMDPADKRILRELAAAKAALKRAAG